ncbi:MAG: hypothetical protein LC768_13590 [Acidobacteria bacterium]|nr:hypothetical protein [Acidobacteriota bacterium]MCA1639343.1 hypothetical protein [Acidobacteriota bacterium]
MNKTTQTKQQPNSFDIAATGLGLYKQFVKASFKSRKQSLSFITDLVSKENEYDAQEFLVQFKSILLNKHIEKTAFTVLDKYDLIGKKPTSKDFYRICKAENIEVSNKNKAFRAEHKEKLQASCYFRVKDFPGAFIILNENLKGRAMRRQQFELLGSHFLHRDSLLKPTDAIEAMNNKSVDPRKEEATYFAILMLGKSY